METTKACVDRGIAPRILSLIIVGYEWSPSRYGRFNTDDSESDPYTP